MQASLSLNAMQPQGGYLFRSTADVSEAMVLTYRTRPRVLIPMARLCDLGGNGLKNVRSKLRLELISGSVARWVPQRRETSRDVSRRLAAFGARNLVFACSRVSYLAGSRDIA